MKKLVHSMLAAAVLCAAGVAMAQDGGAECQGAASSGGRAGCGAGPSTPQYPTAGVPVTPPPGAYNPPYAYRNYGRGNYAYGPQYQPQPAYTQARPSRRDRDGDGVANRSDRYPNDPSRW